MKKIFKFALGIEYNGSNYHGWQKQKEFSNTIQQHIENAISIIANHNIEIFCAGRTDIGVHSIGQVIHFETVSIRKIKSWILGINSLLPKDIVVTWIVPVTKEFHARFSAISRKYYYIIYNSKYRSGILNKLVTQYQYNLDIKKMNKAAKYLIGENDLTSFRSVKCQSSSSYRRIIHLNIKKYNNYIIIDIKANSFVYHMVRTIVGCLLEIGSHSKKEIWLLELLKKKDRTKAATTVKPNGLFLVEIEYPKRFNIPYYSNLNFLLNL
ncbi:tRNA pseudouridine(38-40) synthase TruA [Enterobacteriaceae endosymbiont of Plateumaris braccata]|uniref:tRNA pseudouridine(38-40) synthase TruA n=1 Tax=Enterobacteriaceae endosymbiont of Plateumaris braccata TaxID=2675793 RepID=UPI00144901AB|nr:tRNA pseudouridine(38-40) synthase TruA [Enterobacteriaceae endosymbiont of Plateumaris braccata]QJC28040.1 tRNA pseudouridine(38-40) synthase TruA [Enterobacteriaceae endosymbiont of Plateumaris braccata]